MTFFTPTRLGAEEPVFLLRPCGINLDTPVQCLLLMSTVMPEMTVKVPFKR